MALKAIYFQAILLRDPVDHRSMLKAYSFLLPISPQLQNVTRSGSMTLGDQEPQLGIQHNRKQINSSNFVGVLNQGLATLGGRLGRNISQDG